MLQVRGLNKTFGGGKSLFGFGKPNREVKAVQNVELDLHKVKRLALLARVDQENPRWRDALSG